MALFHHKMTAIGAATTAGALLIMTGPSLASTELLGKFNAWAAFQTKENGRRVCYIEAEPRKKAGDYTKRGDVFVQVIHRPWKKGPPEVGFNAGYRLATRKTVRVTVGPREFSLAPENKVAWPSDIRVEGKLVTAMKRGATMVVKGNSWRGTLTTDTYSLDGFSAALKAAYRACR